MMTDYYLVRRGRLHVPDLYTFDKEGNYWYTAGLNWRCFVAYLAGILINIVGFVGDVAQIEVPIVAVRIYQIAFFCGFFLSALVYYILCRIFPIPGMEVEGWHEDLEYEPVDSMGHDYGEELKVEEAQSISFGMDATKKKEEYI